MFPFKKKEKDDFKLDEISLPSISDSDSGFNSDSSNSMPEMPRLDTSSDFSSQNSMNNPLSDNLSEKNSFNSLANTTPTFSGGNNLAEDTSSLHNDLLKAKMELVESKVSIMDSKIDKIDKKLDVIYAAIMHEVSDATKQKLSVSNMMESVRNK